MAHRQHNALGVQAAHWTLRLCALQVLKLRSRQCHCLMDLDEERVFNSVNYRAAMLIM